MFQAMKNLEYMPLQYSVISPLAASEDFTLPDVSQKNLAFNVSVRGGTGYSLAALM